MARLFKAGKVASAAVDMLARPPEVGDRAGSGHAIEPAGSGPPDRNGKWPKPLRISFITGAALALWVLIFYAVAALF